MQTISDELRQLQRSDDAIPSSQVLLFCEWPQDVISHSATQVVVKGDATSYLSAGDIIISTWDPISMEYLIKQDPEYNIGPDETTIEIELYEGI